MESKSTQDTVIELAPLTDTVQEDEIQPVEITVQEAARKQRIERRKGKKGHKLIAAIALNDKEDDIEFYYDRYSCTPNCDQRTGSFPFFILITSIIQISIFTYYYKDVKDWKHFCGFEYSMVRSDLIFTPRKRAEVWRFYTYQFLHAGFPHIFGNVLMQLFLGIPLELVHGSIRIGLVYSVGVILGSLCASIVDTRSLLLGCSGGDYCLIFAYVANIILNCDHMHIVGIVCRLIPVSAYISFDLYETYKRYMETELGNVSYAAHIGGAIAGLTFGVCMLKNFSRKPWEDILWIISVVIFVVIFIFAVFWNIQFGDYSIANSDDRDVALAEIQNKITDITDDFKDKMNAG